MRSEGRGCMVLPCRRKYKEETDRPEPKPVKNLDEKGMRGCIPLLFVLGRKRKK